MTDNIATMTDTEIESLIANARSEQQKRQGVQPPVCWWWESSDDNAWCKVVKAVDPQHGDGYGIIGDWVEDYAAHPTGTYVVIGTSKDKSTPRTYILARIEREMSACLHLSRIGAKKKRRVCGEHLRIIAKSYSTVDMQAIVDQWPDLAPAVGTPMLPIYAALRAAGI